MNVKGPIRLEELAEKIGLYLKATRGLVSTSMDVLETIVPGKIGAPIDKERVEHAAISRADTIHDGLGREDLTKTVEDFESPMPLSEMLGQNMTNQNKRKHLRPRGTSIDLGPALDRVSLATNGGSACGEKVGSTSTSSQSIFEHGFFGDVHVSGIVKRTRLEGVVVYRALSRKMRGDNSDISYVALKIAECNAERDIETLEELKNEGNIAIGLNHENICQLIDMIATPE